MLIKHVQEPWFNFIKNGQKTVEGRLNKGSFKELNKGDIVIWKNGKKKLKTCIISIHHHKNFNNMLKQHRLSNVLPGIKTFSDGVEIYSKFYSASDVLKYGVLAIKVKVIS